MGGGRGGSADGEEKEEEGGGRDERRGGRRGTLQGVCPRARVRGGRGQDQDGLRGVRRGGGGEAVEGQRGLVPRHRVHHLQDEGGAHEADRGVERAGVRGPDDRREGGRG